MEIEIPRRLVKSVTYLLFIGIPLMLGLHVSPETERNLPLLLTPRLALLQSYRQEIQDWVKVFELADSGLAKLLDGPATSPFDQNEQVSRLYQRISQTNQIIDQTPVPTTFEPLNDLLVQTATTYLDATVQAARWINEPDEENLQLAKKALISSKAMLERLYLNPWMDVHP